MVERAGSEDNGMKPKLRLHCFWQPSRVGLRKSSEQLVGGSFGGKGMSGRRSPVDRNRIRQEHYRAPRERGGGPTGNPPPRIRGAFDTFPAERGFDLAISGLPQYLLGRLQYDSGTGRKGLP